MNVNLHRARNIKNDEFYTQLPDISKELLHYENHFNNKTVFCNCDNPYSSAFWEYFHLNFARLGLKKLICVYYNGDKPSYKTEYLGGNDGDIRVCIKTKLLGNGDFRSYESVCLMNESDIIVTNPPFSLAREYILMLMKYNKLFLIIGDINWITCKEVFPFFKSDKIWFGNHFVKEFMEPDGTVKKFGNKLWFTNLDINKRHNKLSLQKLYVDGQYQHYDNYDAININKVLDIPIDYYGVMGVPITYLNWHNPDEFDILGITLGNTVDYPMLKSYELAIQHNKDGTVIGGSKINTRAVLRFDYIPKNRVYYTAANVIGYLVAVYPRILILKKK